MEDVNGGCMCSGAGGIESADLSTFVHNYVGSACAQCDGRKSSNYETP